MALRLANKAFLIEKNDCYPMLCFSKVWCSKSSSWPVKSYTYESAVPSLLAKRRSIQLSSTQTPLRQVLFHDRDEAIVMMPLDEMDEFVNNDILKALQRLLSEFEVQPDATSFDAAGAPLSFRRFAITEG
jgi:hypothetical protein